MNRPLPSFAGQNSPVQTKCCRNKTWFCIEMFNVRPLEHFESLKQVYLLPRWQRGVLAPTHRWWNHVARIPLQVLQKICCLTTYPSSSLQLSNSTSPLHNTPSDCSFPTTQLNIMKKLVLATFGRFVCRCFMGANRNTEAMHVRA